MSEPRVLLLLPSTTYRAAAYLEAAGRLGVRVTVASDHTSVFASEQPDRLLALDFSDPGSAVEQVRTFAAEHPVAAVTGVDDDTMVLAAHIAEGLRLPGNPVAATEAARDKHLQRRILRDAGIPVPSFELHRFEDDIEAVAAGTKYPCVLKPTRLSASRGVIRANDASEFVTAARRLRRILSEPDAARACGEQTGVFLAEAFVPGPEVAIEAMVHRGSLHILAVFDKPDPLDGPFFEETIYVTPSRLPGEQLEDIRHTLEHSVRAMGLTTGPVHAETRHDSRRAWLIEVAARAIGGRCSAALRFGHDGSASLEELLLRQLLGRLDHVPSRESSASAVMMLPTPRAGTLESVDGVEAAMAIENVTDVQITSHRGQRLVPLPEGSRYLGFAFARAARPEAAEAAVREAHAALKVVYAD